MTVSHPDVHVHSEGWYLPAPKLQGIDRAELKLLSVDKTSDTRRNYTFEAKCKLCITLRKWSIPTVSDTG